MSKSYLWSEDAYETKVMLESIRTELSNALAFIEIIEEKYAHVKCPQVGLPDEDHDEMMGAGDNRPCS